MTGKVDTKELHKDCAGSAISGGDTVIMLECPPENCGVDDACIGVPAKVVNAVCPECGDGPCVIVLSSVGGKWHYPPSCLRVVPAITDAEIDTLRARVAELESQLESIRAFGSAPTTMELINALPDAIRDYIVSLLDTSGATEAYIKQLDEQLQTAQQQLAEARKLALSEAADTVSHMAGSGLHNHIEGYSLLRRCESEIRTLAAIEAAKGENNV